MTSTTDATHRAQKAQNTRTTRTTESTPLHTGWTVTAVGGDVPAALADRLSRPIPAEVPGCIHTDLLRAGLIDDPYLDRNETEVAWVGRVTWRYRTGFDHEVDPERRVELVAHGLDTIAMIELNGHEVARTSDMHRRFTFDVTDAVVDGDNELTVTFAAGEPAAYAAAARIGERPYVGDHPFNAIRKAACHYGWDWGPTLITAGIWRPLELRTWTTARIDTVRPLVDVEGDDGVLRCHVTAKVDTGADLTVEVDVTGPDGTVKASGTLDALEDSVAGGIVEVRVPSVRRWWPRDHGGQPLYDVTVALTAVDATAPELDRWRGRVGFRTVALDTTPDDEGTPFRLVVNGRVIRARGVNWIPDDCFLARVDAARYAARLQQAHDAGVNLVRVWGGGLYESDDFYDVCDELGLLVWQDFAFACAAYSEDEPLRSEVTAEARDAVTRLSPHPSLVLWNGNNENIWGHEDWGWKDRLGDRSWGWGYYTELLPAIVAELDPSRPYSPGSPYTMRPDRPDLHPNDPDHGTMHIWDVWNEEDYLVYAEHRPRFCSEFGFQGPPTWSTLTRAVHDEPMRPDSPGVLAHQKAADGNDKLARGLASHLPAPTSFADWHWATTLNQARAIAFGIEHLRSWAPRCSGAIVWQLNDCWPVTSWAVVDGDGRRKPAWYALRRAFAERLLTIQPRDGGLALVAVNDAVDDWRADVTVTRTDVRGEQSASCLLQVDVEAGGAVTYRLPPEVAVAADPRTDLLVVESGGRRTVRPFAEDIDADLPDPELSTEVTPTAAGFAVRVTAASYVRDLALLADRVDPAAAVDDMLVTLLPGDAVTFEVTCARSVDPASFTDPEVLRSANQLVALSRQCDVAAAALP